MPINKSAFTKWLFCKIIKDTNFLIWKKRDVADNKQFWTKNLHKILFSAIKNLKTDEFTHPILKAIIQCWKYPSILTIKKKNDRQKFDFCRVSTEDVLNILEKISLK